LNEIQHVLRTCDGSCETDGVRCYVCNGLAICSVCTAAEGELLTFCPGYALGWQAKDACYHGNVLDFNSLKRMKESGYNVRTKKWDK